MEIKEVQDKAKKLEDTIWKLVYDFEQETGTSVVDIHVSRISNMGERKTAFYQIQADVKLW